MTRPAKIYFATHMSGQPAGDVYKRVDELREWLEYVGLHEGYDYVLLLPWRDLDLHPDDCFCETYDSLVTAQDKAIKRRDKHDVRRSDLVFFHVRRQQAASIGVTHEVAWADVYERPSVMYMDINGPYDYPMFRDEVWAMTDNMLEAAKAVKNFIA